MKKASQRVTPGGGTRAAPSALSPGSPLSDPRSRTPSPAHGPRAPASRPGLASSLQLSMTEEESEDSADGEPHSDNDEKRRPGVRYITEDLIKRLTKQDSLAFVRSLNLSLARSGGKKFKFIENLEKCERLQVLNLSHNLIEKIEKLEKLHKLRELHLSHNRIRKIEGLEHMGSLQHLNLAGNDIEHLPMWLAKKLKSLHTLNLQRNNICSLHEISMLKPLKNLTELLLAENPVSNLPHCRLFLVFHLRALERLDGQVITQQERELAHQRFHMEEVERLEQELEARLGEVESLREEQAVAMEELEHQGALNQSLQCQRQKQQQCQAEVERELETKNQLLKQKTMELTRACQKQYELEQELAFHKIDAKFEPLPYYPDQELESEGAFPGESPYIGKAWHKRNALALETVEPDGRRQAGQGHMDTDAPGSPDPQGSSHAQDQAEERLRQLQREIENSEQQILRASGELRQLEEAISQKRITEAEKEQLRQQLRRRICLLEELRGEAQALEGQLDRSRGQMSHAQGELEQLQDLLHGLDPSDPRHGGEYQRRHHVCLEEHGLAVITATTGNGLGKCGDTHATFSDFAHVKAQVSSKSQQLDMMSMKYRELEDRLDDMLSRIAKETEEIRDLEQQLTDGQIAANDALKRDLEGIIAGLQEYLHGVKGQAHRAQKDCHQLEREREALQRRLQDSEEQRSQLEIVAMDAESAREEVSRLEQELAGLRDAQGQISAYEAELEAQLQQRDTEAGQLQEELGRLRRLSQMEQLALQAELEKERQAKENALVQVQLVSERQQENERLLEQLRTLQEERSLLREELSALQGALEETRGSMLSPQEVLQRLEDLRRSISSGLGEVRPPGEGDALGCGLAELQQELRRAVSAAQTERDRARSRQGRLTQEMAALRDKLRHGQEEQRAACDSAAQARVAAERRESEAEAELRRLREELQVAQEAQGQTEQRLQEAEEERERLLADLEEREHQMKAEDSRTRLQLRSLDEEMRELKRSMATADKMATQQLTAAKDQLRSLHGTVRKINQERAEDAEELDRFRMEATAVGQDLARAEAEIQLLQKLLKDREQQVYEQDGSVQGVPNSSGQQQELERLNQALDRQQAQTKRLWDQLARAREDNRGDLEELVEEIGALRDTLAQQSSFVSNLGDPLRSRGCWYYVPSTPNPPSVGSQGTRDSGLGSQYPPSPERGRRMARRGRKEREEQTAPPSGGYWMYSPLRRRHSRTRRGRGEPRDSGGESDGDSSVSTRHFAAPPGAAIYTVLPDGSALPPGTVIYAPPAAGLSISPGAVVYGPPPAGAPLLYGPPPASFPAPLVPAGVLHCNVPGHQEAERELVQLLGQKGREERPGADVSRLQDQRAQLEQELQDLRGAVNRLRRRRDTLAGSGSSLAEEVQQSLRQQGEVLEEVECVEKTLLRRRVELREANRLLLAAESDLKDARAKTKETLQCDSEAHQRVEDTERELEELERHAQDSATQLVEANLQLRTLQEEAQELQRRRAEQEQTLREVEEVVELRDAEFQDLNSEVQAATERLEALRSELQQAQGKEARHVEMLREAESMLGQRRTELDALSAEVRVELERLAQVTQRQRAEGEQQKRQLEQERAESEQQLERERADLEALRQEARDIKEKAEALGRDRVTLEDQCRNLEARRGHAERCLARAEEGSRAAEAELARLEAELGQMRRDHKRACSARQDTGRDVAAAQRQLEEKREELKGLQEALSEARQRLERVEEDARATSRRREELLEEQQRQEEELEKGAERVREGQRRGEELEAELGERHARLQQQEKSLQVLQRNALDAEELQTQRLKKLQAQLRAVEGALAERGEQLRQVTDSVAAEEQKRLGQELSARTAELEGLQGELTESQEEVQHLQEVLLTERRRQAALRARGQAERDQMEQEQLKLQRELVTVDQAARENHQRAKDLQEELNIVSQELLGLKDKLRSQEEGETRRRGIREAMRSLRSDVRAEIRELETSPSDASDTESHKENYPHFTPSVRRPAFNTKDEQWRGEAQREKLRQQEDHLKAQLRRRMWSQEEALSQRRQQTEGSLQGLRRRVDKLDKLLSSSAGSLSHSEPPLKHGRPDVSDLGVSLGNSASSCGPVRLDPALPEKDRGTIW
ncbi:hypothetical protein AAFF_G00064760 [Aldrovandia affinis]|uniref:Centriolin n=1 Tax=Aldrovandia affinis TaxID=143900 RepID=A0AAD7WYQ4_9TELE|nr:hypothetical protein AAFF_G00064760 [Aldrovandia affinis]